MTFEIQCFSSSLLSNKKFQLITFNVTNNLCDKATRPGEKTGVPNFENQVVELKQNCTSAILGTEFSC
jgi:hypothetical protein